MRPGKVGLPPCAAFRGARPVCYNGRYQTGLRQGSRHTIEQEDNMTARQRPDGTGIRAQLVFAAAAIMALAVPVLAQAPGGIAGVLAPGVVPQLVQEGFAFTEGPVGTANGGLYFSDIRVSRTHYLDPAGRIAVVREGTNGANGLALTKDG